MKPLQPLGRPVSPKTLLSIVEVHDSSEWYEIAAQDLPALPPKATAAARLDNAKLLRTGKELLAVLARAYSRHVCESDTEKAWMRTTAKDPFIPPGAFGTPRLSPRPDKKAVATLNDSLDAMAVLATESCALNYKFVTSLLTMCQSKKVRVMMCSIERMHAMFTSVLPGRKLRYVEQLDEARLRYLHYHLAAWEKSGAATWDSFDPLARVVLHAVCFEDFLKGAYAAFIQLVTDQLEGGVPFVQRRMLQYVFEMLAKKPEQEGLLLNTLVSRLFTTEGSMASAASAKLSALLECHGGMKEIVVRRVGALLVSSVSKVHAAFAGKKEATPKKKKQRSSSLPAEVIPTLKGIYRGILFLSEVHFSRKDSKATAEALKCYMGVLSFIFSPSPAAERRSRFLPTYEYEEFSRIIRCISCGLERCISLVRHREGGFDIFDYASGDDEEARAAMEANISALYRAAHRPISFSTNIGLLSLISKLQPYESRFYNLLYERLVDVRMFEAVNRRMLLHLVTSCMAEDEDMARVAAFVRRLLQVATCLVGSNVCTVIARICRGALSANTPLHRMLSEQDTDGYLPGKRDPRFSEVSQTVSSPIPSQADKSHLWECYLHRLSYHPSVAAESCLLLKGTKDGVVDFEAPSVFEELGAVSGQLSSGDFGYTQRSYWTEGRKALPHQVVFKQFFEHRAACDVATAKRKSKTAEEDALSESDEGDELRDIDDLSDVYDSGDERMRDAVSESADDLDYSGTDDEVADLPSGSDDDTDAEALGDSASGSEDEVDSSDESLDTVDSDVYPSSGSETDASLDAVDSSEDAAVDSDSSEVDEADHRGASRKMMEPDRVRLSKPRERKTKVPKASTKAESKYLDSEMKAAKKKAALCKPIKATRTKLEPLGLRPAELGEKQQASTLAKRHSKENTSMSLKMAYSLQKSKGETIKKPQPSAAATTTVSPKAEKSPEPDATRAATAAPVESNRQRRKREAREREEADPDYKKRQKLSRLIQKATKGSFADITDIPGVDEFL
ncbi:MAK21, NOC1, CEBPZ, ribosome biogenesis protein MAK21 [Babesia caballi]|uniref:MAK21, NOC1, CEBPZ, ribosome biogenesis protein MAK21 n=1 Tax=Babesia caballi TaxID=5871 RepID=A0AAV4M2A7_BABCB|nr:MAK21, NOC1, CEBPZ, ribosome biogenesis protein MAK21 [Babesia caballi]